MGRSGWSATLRKPVPSAFRVMELGPVSGPPAIELANLSRSLPLISDLPVHDPMSGDAVRIFEPALTVFALLRLHADRRNPIRSAVTSMGLRFIIHLPTAHDSQSG